MPQQGSGPEWRKIIRAGRQLDHLKNGGAGPGMTALLSDILIFSLEMHATDKWWATIPCKHTSQSLYSGAYLKCTSKTTWLPVLCYTPLLPRMLLVMLKAAKQQQPTRYGAIHKLLFHCICAILQNRKPKAPMTAHAHQMTTLLQRMCALLSKFKSINACITMSLHASAM